MGKTGATSPLLAVCIPTRGVVFTEVMQGVFDNLAGRKAILLTTTDEGLPDCMNDLAERALAAGASHLWIVEEDTVPPAGVLDAMLAADAPLVACDYPVGTSHTCFGFDDDGLLWTGLGCTLIQASVFAEIERPWFECNMNMSVVSRDGLFYFTADEGSVNHRGGHDLSFCTKMKRAGLERHGLKGRECRHLKLKNWNAAPTNKACHDITALPPIVDPWPAYLEKPSCTIVIACYNHGEYLAEAIESALAQTYPCEVIVVDDGSEDDSADVASRYPVALIRQPNRGLPAARNAAIRVAQGTHVLPLDADDVLEPTCVQVMLSTARNAIVRAPALLFGDENRPWLLAGGTDLAAFMEQNRAAACSMFPRAAWSRVGGYDERMVDGYEDWDLWVRILHAGYYVATAEGVQWRYRKHGPSLVTHARENQPAIRAYMADKWRRLGIERPVASALPVTPARQSNHHNRAKGVPVYKVTKRVYGQDVNGRTVLMYTPGMVIDEDDAKRAGLLKGKPSDKTLPKGVTIAPPAGQGDTSDEVPPAKPLTRMNLGELADVCADEEIDPDGANTRAEYCATIKAARIAKDDK
jgi:glycosyltransferase involved in cell wall biosynthesis